MEDFNEEASKPAAPSQALAVIEPVKTAVAEPIFIGGSRNRAEDEDAEFSYKSDFKFTPFTPEQAERDSKKREKAAAAAAMAAAFATAGAMTNGGQRIQDHGPFLSITPKKKPDLYSTQFTSDQMRAVIIGALLKKDWDTLYIYHGNKINQAATQRVNQMIKNELPVWAAQDTAQGRALKQRLDELQGRRDALVAHKQANGESVRELLTKPIFAASTSRMTQPEPWAGWLHRSYGHAALGRQEKRDNAKADRMAARNGAKAGMAYDA